MSLWRETPSITGSTRWELYQNVLGFLWASRGSQGWTWSCWCSLQQASGDQVNHQSPLPRGMPWGKQPARGHCNTHVLPWEPAYFLLEKSNRSHSLTACYLPAGGWNYVVNSKRFPSSLTHHPPNRMQNMVCRTGTLRLQRERNNEVMQSTPVSQCRIPPAANVIAQVVKATGSGAILDPPAGVQKHHCPQRTPTSLMHVLAFTRKDGRVCSVGGSAPRPPGSQRVPLQVPRIHLAQMCQCPLHRAPARCCNSPSWAHFPRLPLQGQRERSAYVSITAQELGFLAKDKNQEAGNPDKWLLAF